MNRRPRLAYRSPSRNNAIYLRCRQIGHFAKEYTKKDTSSGMVHNMESHIAKHKGSSHPYEYYKDEDEENVMVLMCHNCKTHSSTEVIREDDEFFKKLNQ